MRVIIGPSATRSLCLSAIAQRIGIARRSCSHRGIGSGWSAIRKLSTGSAASGNITSGLPVIREHPDSWDWYPVQIPLNCAAIESIYVRRGTRHYTHCIDLVRSGHAGYFLIGMKSSFGDSWEGLSR